MRDVLFCPGCQRRLLLPDDALGKIVQCPACQRVFTAESHLTNPPMVAMVAKPAPTQPARAAIRYDDDADRSRSRRGDLDDRVPSARRIVPHRGGEILTFGLLALLPCCLTSIIFGVIAWMMANTDLAEMRNGRMDREGEGLSQAGRALGIAGLIIWSCVTGCFFLSFRL
jgi:hypothetical protein